MVLDSWGLSGWFFFLCLNQWSLPQNTPWQLDTPAVHGSHDDYTLDLSIFPCWKEHTRKLWKNHLTIWLVIKQKPPKFHFGDEIQACFGSLRHDFKGSCMGTGSALCFQSHAKGKEAQWLSQSEPSLTAGVPEALFWDTAAPPLVSEGVREAGMQENGNPSMDGGDTIEMSPMGVEGTHSGQGHITRDKKDSTAIGSLWETTATGSPHHTQALWG